MLETGYHSLHDVIARALHDPSGGYYARHVTGIGRTGDFSTSATLGNALAKAIARWAMATARDLGVTQIIEAGAGDGSLARGIRSALPWLHPMRRHYSIVDTSEPLRALQRKNLGNKVAWFATMEEALAACAGRALIIGNELVDAFPPAVLVRGDGNWQEAGLDVGADGVVREVTRPWAGSPHRCGALDPDGWPSPGPQAGQRIEHLGDFAGWQQGWLPAWARGACLWIDYGARFPQVYQRRPQGTLRAYFRHQRLAGMDVFRRLGKQDITCDVNFSDLQAWGEAMGLDTASLESQAAFLHRHKVVDSMDPSAGQDAAGAFMVLCQHRLSSD